MKRLLQAWRRPTPLAASLVCLALAIVPAVADSEWVTFCITLMNLMVLAYSLNMVVGLIGYLDFGHVVFWGLGAYVAGGLVKAQGGPIGFHPFFLVPFSGLVAAAFALAIGFPALRIRGAYFAIATYSINAGVQTVFFNWNALGGSEGLPLNRYLLEYPDKVTPTYYVLVISLFLAFWTFYGILKGRAGYGLRAILNDEDVAQTMGVNTTAYKIAMYALGAFFAGIAGGTWGLFQNFVDPENFRISVSVDLFVIMMLGGVGTALGPLVGGAIFYFVRDLLMIRFPHLHLVFFGTVLVIVVLGLPGGLVGTLREWRPRWRRVLE